MADQLQIRGGDTASNSTFTGAQRELSIDTSKNQLIVHDGATPGGHPIPTASSPVFTGDAELGGDLTVSGSAEFDGNISFGDRGTGTHYIGNTNSGNFGNNSSWISFEDGESILYRINGASSEHHFLGSNGDSLAKINGDGSGDFASNVTSGGYNSTSDTSQGSRVGNGSVTAQRPASQGSPGTTATFTSLLGQVKKARIFADGSADFKGEVIIGDQAAQSTQLASNGFAAFRRRGDGNFGSVQLNVSNRAFEVNDKDNNLKIKLEYDGTAEFSGPVKTIKAFESSRAHSNPSGLVFSGLSSGSQTSSITVAGNATFAGGVTAASFVSTAGLFSNTVSGSNVVLKGRLNGVDKATILGSGAATFTSVNGQAFSIQLEADDDTKYDVTTEEYEETIRVPVVGGVGTADLVDGKPEQFEEKTITRTREVRTYNGAVLDVKSELQSLRTRATKQDETIALMTNALREMGADVSQFSCNK